VVVHDVKVHNVGAGLQDIVDFRTERGEIGRQNGGGNEKVLISPDIQRSARPSGGLLSVENMTVVLVGGGGKGENSIVRKLT
jgi:hypothetical protein